MRTKIIFKLKKNLLFKNCIKTSLLEKFLFSVLKTFLIWKTQKKVLKKIWLKNPEKLQKICEKNYVSVKSSKLKKCF